MSRQNCTFKLTFSAPIIFIPIWNVCRRVLCGPSWPLYNIIIVSQLCTEFICIKLWQIPKYTFKKTSSGAHSLKGQVWKRIEMGKIYNGAYLLNGRPKSLWWVVSLTATFSAAHAAMLWAKSKCNKFTQTGSQPSCDQLLWTALS